MRAMHSWTSDLAGWIVELIAVEYDWNAASARTLKNGRHEWAQGLATGFLSPPTTA